MSIESFEFWTILRLLVPLTILKWPLFGTILSAFTDIKDWDFLVLKELKEQADYDFYQVWDKLLDTYYLTFAAFTSLKWKDQIAKRISILSFSYRTVGLFLFLITGVREILFFFPNFFENFFYFYLFFVKFSKKKILFISRFWLVLVIGSILAPKVVQEFLVHVVKKTPVEFFGLREISILQEIHIPPLDIPYLLPIVSYFAFPILILLLRIRVK